MRYNYKETSKSRVKNSYFSCWVYSYWNLNPVINPVEIWVRIKGRLDKKKFQNKNTCFLEIQIGGLNDFINHMCMCAQETHIWTTLDGWHKSMILPLRKDFMRIREQRMLRNSYLNERHFLLNNPAKVITSIVQGNAIGRVSLFQKYIRI